MLRALAFLIMLAGCARGGTAPAPEPTTTGALDVSEAPMPTVVWHTVDDLGENERYVILGSAEAPNEEGRLLEGGEVDTFLHETGGDVPALTLVGYQGSCGPTRARRVVIVSRIDPDEPHTRAFDAVAVASECEPVLAIEGVHPEARLAALEISDPPFGEPFTAIGEGWNVRLEYGPSEDGICPGFPLHVQVSRGDELLLTRDFPLMLSHIRIAMLGERAWLVLGALEEELLLELGSDDDETRFSSPSGVDLAQTCT